MVIFVSCQGVTVDTLENGLQVELNETAPCCFTLKALIPAAEVSKTYADVLTKYIAKTRTPGFRAGRAPKALVEKMHGADIKADASQTLVTRMLDEAIKKYRLRPSSQIEFADDKAPELSKDADMAVGFKFEAYANFELPDYAGMALENPEEPVDEEKVDEAMETFLHTCGTYKTVDREAAAGDMLKVDYTCDADQALRDDQSASYMLKGENSWMVLRESAEMLPGITAALAGLKGGDSNAGRTFAVSRIEEVKLLDNTFQPRPELYDGTNFDNFDDRNAYGNIEIRLTRAG